MHFPEARMDASFGTNPLAREKATLHRFRLAEIDEAIEVMASKERNKVIIINQ